MTCTGRQATATGNPIHINALTTAPIGVVPAVSKNNANTNKAAPPANTSSPISHRTRPTLTRNGTWPRTSSVDRPRNRRRDIVLTRPGSTLRIIP